MQKGLVHVYTGNGKGKTTAGIGLAVRARGNGLKVLFAQFFKEKPESGEVPLLSDMGIQTIIYDKVKSPYFNPDIDKEQIREEARKALSDLRELIRTGSFDLVLLDEFNCLLPEGVITETEAIEFLSSRPYELEIVLTGSGAPASLIEYADYVTVMEGLKHPYTTKRQARKGIEF